jgi:hypothetical protein
MASEKYNENFESDFGFMSPHRTILSKYHDSYGYAITIGQIKEKITALKYDEKSAIIEAHAEGLSKLPAILKALGKA